MKVDLYKLELAQARTRKSWDALGIDRRTIMRIKRGNDTQPLTVAKLAAALGVDPEDITVRGDQL